jgi:hypothetical protein
MASNDNRGKQHEKLRDVTRYLSRPRLLAYLKKKRYKYKYYGIIKPITLPSSKAYVRMVCNDASACLQSIMTDPRLDKADYLLGPRQSICTPPDNLDYIGDINSGLSTKIHGQNVTDPTNRY